VLVDNLSFDNGKTKEALMFLNKFELNRKILLIYSKQDEKLIRAFRNLQEVKIIPSCAINVYDLINAKHIIVERNIFEDLIKEANLA
jgi:ribosomal protein L4